MYAKKDHLSSRGTAGLVLITTALLSLAGCQKADNEIPPEIRPVRVVVVETRGSNDTVALTGRVQAETEINLAFRIDGRMVSRAVNVGDTVRPGQEVARLNPENEENALRAAEANLQGARGQLTEARANETRNRALLAQNFISQAAFDRIAQLANSAQAQVDAARAQVTIAQDRLSYTRLVSDGGGVVTRVGAEPGEVVQAGRMVVELARQEGRDAVFDVPAPLKDAAPRNPEITVSLASDPKVTAQGRVREVSPRADPATGAFRVRVGLIDPPAAMRLGTTVTGRMKVASAAGIEIPSSALTRNERGPAVWVVDPKAETVSLRTVELVSSDLGRVIVGEGLENGEIVVTAGVQALRPGQKVRLLRGEK